MELRVEHLSKSYGDQAVLRDVSFTAGAGIHCLMAPSGAGKTTLLRILLGLETADSGTISGAEGWRWAAVFQENRLLEHLSARENLRFALGDAFSEDRAAGLLAELGLALEEPKPVRAYSGGMKRRLALCRALLADSDALALDEPFTGLDGESRGRCMEAIRRESAGKLVLLVTHDPQDAERLGTAVLNLAKSAKKEG